MEAHAYLEAQMGGAPADSLDALRERVLGVSDFPNLIEEGFLTVRFEDFERYFGPGDEITRAALRGQAPAVAAKSMLEESVLSDAERAAAALESGSLTMNDPAVWLAAALMPVRTRASAAQGQLGTPEDQLESDLGRVRFEVYGRTIPPDGTFSPRITDGVVQGYEYNGTMAPPYTTFYGLYDRYRSHGPDSEWDLPERWRTPPEGLDLSTPLNFASTADTYGGNSGSPAVTPALELVGLGRNVMVDVRAIHAALQYGYGADRIVVELTTGGM
jgi:hypothetical protein